MNSHWARFMGVAVGVIAMGLASYAEAASSDDQKLHVAAAPADFAPWHRSRNRDLGRWPTDSNIRRYFEWWYFDGLLDDGTVVVVWLGDNWFYGSHNRAVTMELTPPGEPTRRVMRPSRSQVHSRAIVRTSKIGPHQFKGDLDTYFIHVDPAETGRVRLRSDAGVAGSPPTVPRPATLKLESSSSRGWSRCRKVRSPER